MAKKKKPQGHFCYVCGEHKANEKFSGKGHANHICKVCVGLPVAERNEMQAIRRIESMAMRYLNEAEVKWLRKRLKDPRPEVQAAAREVHHMKFQRYERGQLKKGLAMFSLEFYMHGDVGDEDGDEFPVHARIIADQDGVFRLMDYATEQEMQIVIEKAIAKKFLKSLIHEWDILFWDQDLSDLDVDDLDIIPEYYDVGDMEDDEDIAEDAEEASSQGEPLWSMKLDLNNGEEKQIVFYSQMHSEVQELYWALMEAFEPVGIEDEPLDQ